MKTVRDRLITISDVFSLSPFPQCTVIWRIIIIVLGGVADYGDSVREGLAQNAAQQQVDRC